MKQPKYFILGLMLTAMVGCKPDATQESTEKMPITDEHNSRNSLDWEGVYQGILPCPDCDGIEILVALSSDNTFIRSIRYLGKKDNGYSNGGQFKWDRTGSNITLADESGSSQTFSVGENVLFLMDDAGKVRTGEAAEKFQLSKNKTDGFLENHTWHLKSLFGNPISADRDSIISLYFNRETGIASGFNDCNNVKGRYEILDGNRLHLGQFAGTLKLCPDMTIADNFNKMISQVDGYSVNDRQLKLISGASTEVATFEKQTN